MANEIVFQGLEVLASPEGFPTLSGTGRLQCIMNNDLNYGGHLSAQPYGALFNFAENNIIHFPIDPKNPYKADTEKMLALATEHRPALIVFGKSMFRYPAVRFQTIGRWLRRRRLSYRPYSSAEGARRLPEDLLRPQRPRPNGKVHLSESCGLKSFPGHFPDQPATTIWVLNWQCLRPPSK
jgi:hypothetical protein